MKLLPVQIKNPNQYSIRMSFATLTLVVGFLVAAPVGELFAKECDGLILISSKAFRQCHTITVSSPLPCKKYATYTGPTSVRPCVLNKLKATCTEGTTICPGGAVLK